MNDPWRKRTPRSTLVKWLTEHDNLWFGYPQPINPLGTKSHAQLIFKFMQNAGLFSQRSQYNPRTITRLVNDARAAMQLNQDQAAVKKLMNQSEP